eukprot:TRINITY_DN2057_c0_g1_i1.p1 TRINITY_DN2057_c0_g1~~TRINITY_DN2057_c0_g1_i1.p1  ORF type:complete len:104 (+),score=19.44 TRINITY_DN2057_c0_g1_i1:356-667(+)
MDRPIQLVSAECDEIPQLVEYVGKSMPCFLLYKKSALMDTVEGVNAPQIERACADHVPSKDELATSTDDPDSEDESPSGAAGDKGPRRSSLSHGLGRRRSVVK